MDKLTRAPMEHAKQEIDKARDQVDKLTRVPIEHAKNEFDRARGQMLQKQTSFNTRAVETIEQWSQKRGKNTDEERFRVVPEYAYPNTRFNRSELRAEMNKPSQYYHHLQSLENSDKVVGKISLEILQCFGIPKPDLLGETSAYCVAVCGPFAFQTDTMPPVANPMWLSKMRRACTFDLNHGYARVYVGVFGSNGNPSAKDGFAGRIVLDVARLRPNSTYDVTLPLRQSAHVYSKEQRGAIRLRFHLQWYSERRAILSYLPKKIKVKPKEDCVINCCDSKSFQNIARLVHGYHLPGKFTMKQVKATIREMNFTRIHVTRYLRKRELRNLRQWRIPLISAFVFGAWMHSVYHSTVAYVPGHLLTYLLLHLWKNYAYYSMNSTIQNGFLPPSFVELFWGLLFGKDKESSHNIQSLELKRKASSDPDKVWDDMLCSPSERIGLAPDADSAREIMERALAFRRGMPTRRWRNRLQIYTRVFRGSEAVDFMLKNDIAPSRKAAVDLGIIFQRQLRVFEQVHRKHDFADENHHYRFLASFDPHDFSCNTHEPQGRWLLGFLGLLPPDDIAETDAHMEMPYATGVDHPRFTVRDSLVIRSRVQKRLLMHEQEDGSTSLLNQSVTQNQSDQLAQGLKDILDESDDKSTANDTEEEDNDDGNEQAEEAMTYVKMMKKPPPQDINVVTKASRKMPDVLKEARHRAQRILLHNFDDRVYRETVPRVPDLLKKVASPTRAARNKTVMGSPRKGALLSLSNPLTLTKRQRARARSSEAENRKDEYDRLLGVDKYSSGNPWMSRIGVLVQPIIEMFLEGLCLFRALFNIFTWRDPIFSFWVALLGPVVVLVMHLFPWRIVLGLVGIGLFGPQNYVVRLIKERNGDVEEYDPDKLIKKKVTEVEEVLSVDAPLFSMRTPNNEPIDKADIDATDLKQVVVPYSPLMYQRFYDWPPENQYAHVIPSEAPTNLDRSGYATPGSTGEGSQGSVASRHSWTLRDLHPIRGTANAVRSLPSAVRNIRHRRRRRRIHS